MYTKMRHLQLQMMDFLLKRMDLSLDMQAIPDLSAAPRDEFIVDVNLPTGYDPAARLCGAVRVEVSTLAELRTSLACGRTAFVLLMADRYDPSPTWLTLEQVAPLAQVYF